MYYPFHQKEKKKKRGRSYCSMKQVRLPKMALYAPFWLTWIDICFSFCLFIYLFIYLFLIRSMKYSFNLKRVTTEKAYKHWEKITNNYTPLSSMNPRAYLTAWLVISFGHKYRQKLKTDPLTFIICYFSSLTFIFIISLI